MTCFINVGNSIKGKKVTGQEGLKFAEVIGKKVFSHVSSAKKLFENNRVDLNDGTYVEFVDYSSIAVLTRASLEAYLTFNFIFINTSNMEQSIFRYHCWDLAGYLERQNYQALSKESRDKKKREGQFIIEKMEILKGFDEYNRLSSKQKAQISKGYWKLGASWSDLAQGAKFNKEYFIDIYSFLCSYAHTGRLSALQIMQATELDTQKEFGSLFSSHCLVTLSKFLFDYTELVPELKVSFDSYKQEKFLATIWKNVGEKLRKEDKVNNS